MSSANANLSQVQSFKHFVFNDPWRLDPAFRGPLSGGRWGSPPPGGREMLSCCREVIPG